MGFHHHPLPHGRGSPGFLLTNFASQSNLCGVPIPEGPMRVCEALERLDDIHEQLTKAEVYRGFRVPGVAFQRPTTSGCSAGFTTTSRRDAPLATSGWTSSREMEQRRSIVPVAVPDPGI